MGAAQEAVEALETVVAAMSGGGERRPGQHQMCEAVASARHDLLRDLPPFRRTIDIAEVEAFLADIRRSAETAQPVAAPARSAAQGPRG